MGINAAGVWCDVCEQLLWCSPMHDFSQFTVAGCDKRLICCRTCEPVVEEMNEKKDWKVLPEGPLKRAYERAVNKLERKGDLC